MAAREAFQIGQHRIEPGTRKSVDLHVSVLSNHTPISLPVHVVHGSKPGPAIA